MIFIKFFYIIWIFLNFLSLPLIASDTPSKEPPFIDIGWEDLHKQGLQGQGKNIIVLEGHCTFQANHPAFQGLSVSCFDFGCVPMCPVGFQDSSPFRFLSDSLPLNIDFDGNKDHGQKVLSVLVGNASPKDNYPGGLIPQAQATLITFSSTTIPYRPRGWVHPILRFASTAVYTFREASNLLDPAKATELTKALTSYLSLYPNIWDQKIDNSIYEAFNHAFNTPGKVINASFQLQSPCDHKNLYQLTPHFLDFLSNGLEKNDKILIVTAGNNKSDITASAEKTYNFPNIGETPNLTYFERQGLIDTYHLEFRQIIFQQYAKHPSLKKRIRIVTNIVGVTNPEKDCLFPFQKDSKTSVTFKKGNSYTVCLEQSSNYPGADQDIQNITISTFGTKVVTDPHNRFSLVSGTSFAAPAISGLLVLMDDYFQGKGLSKTGPELLETLDASCHLPTGFGKYYGRGIVDPLLFLPNT